MNDTSTLTCMVEKFSHFELLTFKIMICNQGITSWFNGLLRVINISYQIHQPSPKKFGISRIRLTIFISKWF